MKSSVHALAGLGAVCMTDVAAHEDAMVERVFVRDALANWIDRVPLHPVPFEVVRLEDLDCCCLHLFDGGCFAGVEVRVCRGCGLDVQADHVVLSWDDHDGAVIRVDCAFHFDVREVGPDNTVHDAPDVSDWVFVCDADTKLLAHEASGTLTAEKVFGIYCLNDIAVETLQRDLDWIVRILPVIFEGVYCPRPVDPCPVLLNVFD